MENERAVIGGNLPPSPIDDAIAPYDALLTECDNWANGVLVENKAQMDEVDRLLKQMKSARTDVAGQSKADIRIYKAAHTDAIARWKPTLDDFDDKVSTLVKTGAPFKENLAKEKAEAARIAWKKANAAKIESERVEREANEASIEDQRKVRQAKESALTADKAARAARDDKPKGLRTVRHFEIEDYAKAWGSIPQPEKIAIVTAWVEKNHKAVDIAGVKQWQIKEAF